MKHASDPGPDPAFGVCGVCTLLSAAQAAPPLFENGLWHVRPIAPPTAVPGWMMLITRRHVGGPAHFDDAEAASFGPTLRHLEKLLEEVTGALRIYTAAMGESSPHFHAHMVPRYPVMPKNARAWDVFDLQRASAAGELPVDEQKSHDVAEAYRRALTDRPPPRP